MRTILAALLTAATAMPSLASETPSLPDPTDAAASVPSVNVPAIAGSYQPFQDKPVGSWSELNSAVAPARKKAAPGAMVGTAGTDHSNMLRSPASSVTQPEAVGVSEAARKRHAGMTGNHSEMDDKSSADGSAGAADDEKKQNPHEGVHE